MDRTAGIATALVVLTTVTAAVLPATALAPAAGGEGPGAVGAGDAPAVAGAGDAADGDGDGYTPVPVDNATARLELPRDELDASGVATVQPDLGATLASADEDLHQRSFRVTVEDRFEAANSTNARVLVMDQALIELQAVSSALLDRQHAAIRGYANGSIGESQLLGRLARLDQQARDMLETVSYLRSRSIEMEGQPLDTTINAVEARLETLKGPVRRHAAGTLAGIDSTGGIYVEVSDRNLVLATVSDGRYLREAYFIGNRETEGFPEISGPHEAIEHLSDLYPWASNHTVGTVQAEPLNDVLRLKQPHAQGDLFAYVDANSGDVFYEIQSVRVRSMPKRTVRNVTTEGLQVIVERTYPGGPLQVGVYDAATGNPVNARVSVAGVEVGPTEGGIVHAVEPRSEYVISVRTPRTSANVTVAQPPVE